MKNIIYCLTLVLLVFGVACSYDDHSSDPDKYIPELVIDTTGIPATHLINYGERLVIEPKVSSESNPEGDFTYEWRMGLIANTYSLYKIAGTDEKLDFEVDLLPDAQAYNLWFRVLDNKNKQVRSIIWKVQVDASSGQGLMVAHSNDGITSDLSVIQDTLFTADFKRAASGEPTPTLIKRDVYSAANGSKWPGIIRELTFQQRKHDNRIMNFVDGHSVTKIFRVNLLDFTLLYEDGELFNAINPVINIQAMFLGSSPTGYPSSTTGRFVWNNRAFQYMKTPGTYSDPSEKFGYGIPSAGSLGEDLPGATVTHDPHPIISNGTSYTMFYDKMNGRFMYFYRSYYYDRDQPLEASTTGTAFDPTDVPDLEILAAGMGNNQDHRFIVKQDGEYKILTMLQSNGAARADISINDAPDISKAKYFVICTNQPVIYYATSDGKIYSIFFLDGLGDTVTYKLQYTSPEPINGLYLSRRGGSKTIQYPLTALLMTTTTGQTEGKVWVLPMGTIGTGDLNTGKIVSFGGFGRISTVSIID